MLALVESRAAAAAARRCLLAPQPANHARFSAAVRPLTEDETKVVFEKLHKFIGAPLLRKVSPAGRTVGAPP